VNRVPFNEPVLLSTNPVTFDLGALVEIVERGNSTQVPAYSAETGGSKLQQPLKCSTRGVPVDASTGDKAWVAPGSYDLLVGVAPAEGEEDERQRVSLEMPRGDADSSFEAEFADKLDKTANLSDLASPASARANLGLGSAATAAASAFDAAGAAVAAVTVEKERAEAAEAKKLGKASNLSDLSDASAGRQALGVGTDTVALGTISGLVTKTLSRDSLVTAKLSGNAEIELKSNLSEPTLAEVEVDPQGHSVVFRNVTWVGAEPVFPTTEPFGVTLSVREGGTKVVGWSGLEGKQGKEGPQGKEGATPIEGFTKVAAPLYMRELRVTTEVAIGTAFRALFARVVIAKTGTLHDIAVANMATVNGNHRVAVFDAGAAAGSYTPLWQSGNVAAAGEKAWQVIGDPNLAVTAGQVLYFAVMNDGTTHKFGCATGFSAGALAELPPNYMPLTSGNLPKLCARHNYSKAEFATIKEGELENQGTAIAIIGRIV
jgi:hypothetical protein